MAGASVAPRHLTIGAEGDTWVVRDTSGAGVFFGGRPLPATSLLGPTTVNLGAPNGPALSLVPDQPGTVASDDTTLYLRPDDGEDRVFPAGKPVVVGSDPACDVVVDDALVAPQHVRFDHSTSGWSLTDLGSPRGTYVDRRRVRGAASAAGSFVVVLGASDGGPELGVVTQGEHKSPRNRLPLALGAAALALALIAVLVAVVARPGDDFPSASVLGPSVPLVLSTGNGCTAHGSGSVIADGLILTNFHVVEGMTKCGGRPQVAAGSSERRSESEFRPADLMFYDAKLDLAVLRVGADFDQPVLEIGDSDRLETGDKIRVLGYPSIGGFSLTVTDGIVSGRTEDDDGTWIKTDSGIAGGNSGGAAFDGEGRLIGVPTAGTYLDCDEDAKGEMKCSDYSLGLIRPINEAADVIAQAKAATTAIPLTDIAPAEEPKPQEDGQAGAPLTNARFGTVGPNEEFVGATNGELPASTTELVCIWFDTRSVGKGTELDFTADRDGKTIYTGKVDALEDTGGQRNCIKSNSGTLPAGTYTLSIAVTGKPDTKLTVVGRLV